MVTVKGFQQRKTAEGKTFLVLELEGGLQIQPSQNSGRLYASVAKCTVPCSFDEATAREMIGETLPGTIDRVPCEPYNYTNPQTGETITLNFKYCYRPPAFVADETKQFQSRFVEVETP